MTKSLVVIAMFALIGVSFTSAAAIDLDDNEIPESMEAYKSSLESMLREASKQIKENAAFDENMNLESFEPENMFDDEKSVILTEEEEAEAEAEGADDELSTVEDDRSTENVDSGIRCYWRGTAGHCCQSLRIIRYRIRLCLGIQIHPPTFMRLYLKINGRTIWRRNIGVRNRRMNVCLRRGPLRICFHFYGLHISRHYARVCLAISARLGWFRYRKRLGCMGKRFALDANPTITNKPDSFNVYKKHNDALPPSGFEHNNNDLTFEHNNNVDRFEQ